MTDILIVVSIGLIQLVLTWYGVHISVEKGRKRNALVILGIGLLGVGLTVVAVVRTNHAQEKLQGQLDKIQHNTETPPPPPVVNVTVPPASLPPAHTHVGYLSIPDAAQKTNSPMFIEVGEGKKPEAPVAFINVGEYTVEEPQDAYAIVLTSPKDIDAAFKKARKGMKFYPPSGAIPAHSNQGGYHTAVGAALTAGDVKKFVAGNLAVCAFGAVKWKDATGRYETHFAQCLLSEPGFNAANWHSVRENNVEVLLHY